MNRISEVHHDKHIILNQKENNIFEKVLNTYLPKKYKWFKKFEIDKVVYDNSQNYFAIIGNIYVDSNWAEIKWREYNYSRQISSRNYEFSFSKIIGGELSKEFQGDLKKIFSFITGFLPPKYTSFDWIEVNLVDESQETLQESIRRILKEETQGIDGFLDMIVSKYPETQSYIGKIKSFIEDSNCKKIEVAKFKYPALGLAVHNGILLNELIFIHTLPNFLFIVFHEIAHQYQYKKYGDEKMYEFYLGEIDVKDAAIAMKQIEITADEFASRKIREFLKLGLLDRANSSIMSKYKNIPLSHFEELINQTKQSIKEKGISSFDEIADLFYNIVKINEVTSTTKIEE